MYERESGVILPRRQKIKQGFRRTVNNLTVLVYDAKNLQLIRTCKSVKETNDIFKVKSLQYILNGNKGKELTECRKTDGKVFKLEEKFVF